MSLSLPSDPLIPSHIQNMSCEDMERALFKQTRRPADRIRGQGAPQTARALLEENKQLVLEKQEAKALHRKNSRDFVEKMLADDRMVNEADTAKDIGRRTAQRGLAQYYKSKICAKEAEKSDAYQTKLASGPPTMFFPFIEGETISQNRRAEAGKMREDMRVFLAKQQLEKPPRTDQLLADSDQEYQHRYPYMPVYSQSARGPTPQQGASASASASGPRRGAASASATPRSPIGASLPIGDYNDKESIKDESDTGPHYKDYPKFLAKAKAHMSRRINDVHVRLALEDKVERTKAELAELTRRQQAEAQQWEDGMMVNDALRYDGSRLKAAERQKNASYLEKQVLERRNKLHKEKTDRRAEAAGYWGPDEKALRDDGDMRTHCTDLIKQMEVNQLRKLDSRSRRLQQEKTVIDNSLAEMSADRVKEKEKVTQHKEILTMTWESQQKIRQVMKRIDAL